MSTTSRKLLIAATLLFAGAGILTGHDSAQAIVTCDRVASPSGSDTASGAEAAPFRTSQKLVDSLAPGQTGCLRAGTYLSDQVRIKTPGVTLTNYPGESATLRGRLRFEHQADGAIVEGLVLDGRNPNNWLGPLIYADRVVLRRNDISNGNTAICVHIDDYPDQPAPRNVLIEGNRIHHCGVLPATNHHHGIYLARGIGTVIRRNVIYDNADRGIQLYPEARNTIIEGNIIDGNGVGVIISGGRTSASWDSLIERNIITNSTIRHNVESHWQGPVGGNNIVRNNCVHGGARDDGDGGISTPTVGYLAIDNLVADPLYYNRANHDYRLRSGSPCAALLEAGGGSTGGSGGSTGDPGGTGDAGGTGGTKNKGGGRRVKLSSDSRKVKKGARLRLSGTVEDAASAASATSASYLRATVRVRRGGAWRRVRRSRVNQRGRFRVEIRARRRGGRKIQRFRAVVPGVGRSRIVRIKIVR